MRRRPSAHSSPEQQRIKPGFNCRGRVWIERDGETFLGFGRVVLLEKIRDLGSISKAAAAMKMSYKHAWDLVDSMNRQARQPLVVTSKGGRGGGGAQLTANGEAAIDEFKQLHARLTAFLETETMKQTK